MVVYFIKNYVVHAKKYKINFVIIVSDIERMEQRRISKIQSKKRFEKLRLRAWEKSRICLCETTNTQGSVLYHKVTKLFT